MAFCLSFPKWCNTYTLAEKIKALEHQTFSTHFTSKFMLFWITQKLTFFTHPNIKIAKNGNAPIHWRGFHAFFKNSWPSPPPKISRIVTSFISNNHIDFYSTREMRLLTRKKRRVIYMKLICISRATIKDI